jgi:hypothetical protein
VDRDFDKYLEELSAPLPEEPPAPPPPESIPMEKTELMDLASEAENKKTYLDEGGEPSWKKKKEEGTLAPPVDIYEPGFRTDLYAAIKGYFKKQKETRDRVQKIREKTGIGRYTTWTP